MLVWRKLVLHNSFQALYKGLVLLLQVLLLDLNDLIVPLQFLVLPAKSEIMCPEV